MTEEFQKLYDAELAKIVASRKEAKEKYAEDYVLMLGQDMINSFDRYVLVGCPTGDFLRACLEDSLSRACERADMMNQGRILTIVRYIYNRIPRVSWGSKEAVDAWIKQGGHMHYDPQTGARRENKTATDGHRSSESPNSGCCDKGCDCGKQTS